jgi:hypothetical protein
MPGIPAGTTVQSHSVYWVWPALIEAPDHYILRMLGLHKIAAAQLKDCPP